MLVILIIAGVLLGCFALVSFLYMNQQTSLSFPGLLNFDMSDEDDDPEEDGDDVLDTGITLLDDMVADTIQDEFGESVF